jgi:hypothetical protein
MAGTYAGAGYLSLAAMLMAMCATGVFAVFARVRCMTVSRIGVMSCLFVAVTFMMLCRLHVMASCMRVMFGGFSMMVGRVLGDLSSPVVISHRSETAA